MKDAYSESGTVVYLTAAFPTLSEPYVVREIDALRARGVRVLAVAVWRPAPDDRWPEKAAYADACVFLSEFRAVPFLRSLFRCGRSASRLWSLYSRILFRGGESGLQRIKALAHVWLGVYFVEVTRQYAPSHIHVHHGYFHAWIARVAHCLEGVSYSITFHGSDLLLHPRYLDVKTEAAQFIVTISEHGKGVLLGQPAAKGLDPARVFVCRLGAQSATPSLPERRTSTLPGTPLLLSVGRLHPVKNQEFLVRACGVLRDEGMDSLCLIVGSGPRRPSLQGLIDRLDLGRNVKLIGAVPPGTLARLYGMADICTLTSKSEGIPLVLMEAMLHGALVLAPAITGVPELVIDGMTGFLYSPDDLAAFTQRLRHVLGLGEAQAAIREAAYRHVRAFFDAERNVATYADLFTRMGRSGPSTAQVCGESE